MKNKITEKGLGVASHVNYSAYLCNETADRRI